MNMIIGNMIALVSFENVQITDCLFTVLPLNRYTEFQNSLTLPFPELLGFLFQTIYSIVHWQITPYSFCLPCLQNHILTFFSRYMAICHPFLIQRSANQSSGPRRRSQYTEVSLKKRTCYYMLPVILVSVVVNVPKFLEFKTVSK